MTTENKEGGRRLTWDEESRLRGLIDEWRLAAGSKVAVRWNNLIAYVESMLANDAVVEAARELIKEMHQIHDSYDPPRRYSVPYGAVNRLQDALDALSAPVAQQPDNRLRNALGIATARAGRKRVG